MEQVPLEGEEQDERKLVTIQENQAGDLVFTDYCYLYIGAKATSAWIVCRYHTMTSLPSITTTSSGIGDIIWNMAKTKRRDKEDHGM